MQLSDAVFTILIQDIYFLAVEYLKSPTSHGPSPWPPIGYGPGTLDCFPSVRSGWRPFFSQLIANFSGSNNASEGPLNSMKSNELQRKNKHCVVCDT